MLAGREEQGPGESVLCRSIKAPTRPAAVRPAALHRSASARTLPRVLSHLPGLRITLTVGVVALVVAGALGYLLGHGNRSSVFKVGAGLVYATPNEGTAYLGANEPLNRQPTGFAYSFPPDITWTDATGAIHQGGRPSCVPYDHPVHVQSMEAVMYPIETGGSMGTIVWVKC